MGLTGGLPEHPTIPSKAENKGSDCITFGRTYAQQNAPGALNRIIGQGCSHRTGNDIKRETQNFKTKLVCPTNLPGPWGCDSFFLARLSLNPRARLPSFLPQATVHFLEFIATTFRMKGSTHVEY